MKPTPAVSGTGHCTDPHYQNLAHHAQSTHSRSEFLYNSEWKQYLPSKCTKLLFDQHHSGDDFPRQTNKPQMRCVQYFLISARQKMQDNTAQRLSFQLYILSENRLSLKGSLVFFTHSFHILLLAFNVDTPKNLPVVSGATMQNYHFYVTVTIT